MLIKINDMLQLRQVQLSEKKELYKIVDENREQLREWLPWVDYMKRPRQYGPIIEEWQEANDAQESLTLGVYYDGDLVGMCGYNRIVSLSRRAEIGYWLAGSHVGKGIMTQAVTGLIDYGFKNLNLHRIEIVAGVENKKSRSIPERLQFTEEAMMKDYEYLHDHYHDCVLYRVLKDDWFTKS